MITGSLRIVDNVASAFSRFVTGALATAAPRLRLGCSGGASGVECFERLAASELDWSRIECFFVDERCVEEGSKDANSVAIAAALGRRRDELAGFYPMSCAEGPDAYAKLLQQSGPLDLLQLGVGPDGHTASLFPGADGSDAPDGALVIGNADPSGHNPFERLSLTFAAISSARCVVVTAIGADKADVLRRVALGEDLPIGKVRAGTLVWFLDEAAASELPAITPRAGLWSETEVSRSSDGGETWVAVGVQA